MTLARRQGEISGAESRRVLGGVTSAPGRRRRSTVAGVATLVVLGLLIGGSPARAQIVISGGPTTSPGGGWGCTTPTAGNEKLAGGGSYNCTGTSYPFSNLYIGINKNTAVPFGEKMNSVSNSEPSGTERFLWSTNPGTTQIQYTGTTTYSIDATAGGGSATAFTRVTLTFSGTGSRVDDATTQGLTGTNINGSVHALWRIDPTVTNMTVNVLIEASDSSGGPWTPADTYFGTNAGVHGKNTLSSNGGNPPDRSHVEIAFYTSTCGDGQLDTNFSRESCDPAIAGNSICCTAGCAFSSTATVCRAAAAGVCDVQENCTGGSGLCPTDSFAPSTTICRAAAPGVCDVQ